MTAQATAKRVMASAKAVDRCSPAPDRKQEQDGRDQGAGMADTDPPDQVDDREAPGHRDVQAPDAGTDEEELHHRRSAAASADAKPTAKTGYIHFGVVPNGNGSLILRGDRSPELMAGSHQGPVHVHLGRRQPVAVRLSDVAISNALPYFPAQWCSASPLAAPSGWSSFGLGLLECAPMIGGARTGPELLQEGVVRRLEAFSLRDHGGVADR